MGPWGTALARLRQREAGSTLAEVLVAVSIGALAVGFVGTAVFQVLGIDRTWRAEVEAVRELRNAGTWFSSDALNAESTDIVDGAPPVSSVLLTWKDDLGQQHTAQYALANGNLVRTFDFASIAVARGVAAAQFSVAGRILTFDLTVPASNNRQERWVLQTCLRSAA